MDPTRIIPTFLAALASAAITSADPVTVLVEAESFDTKGGWKVDTQSVEQMGSVYLIAHGLGTPVADASTLVSFPETGDYRLWVRNRDWVPGAWAAPGRFKVAVDGSDLAAEFGSTTTDWDWQDGGIIPITAANATVALRDLTGFDGRCDALAFIKGSDEPPPASGEPLAAWRRMIQAESPAPGDIQNFDCVVIGGGIAGCCAAYAAAEQGCSVALVQDRPYLGGNASREIRVKTEGEVRHRIVEMFKSAEANRSDAMITDDIRRLDHITNQPNISLWMPWRAEAAGTGPDARITHVDIRHTHTHARSRLQAPIFIDCTGDGWVGFWAGADYRVGREGADEFDESRAPAVADNMTMGNSLMWKSADTGSPSTFPAVPWAMDVAGSRAETGGGWNWEYGMHLDTIADAEEIRDHLLQAIYGNFYNAKQNPQNANRALDWVPYIAGKRESRRLMGDHLIIEDDVRSGAFFEDAVGTATWSIDLHYPTAVSYRSTYTPTHVAKWFFPFRSLYSRNIPNLMMAGRCISVSHVGLGSPRVQNTTGQMGVAVGYATSLCKQHGIEPRDIYRDPDLTLDLQALITGTWPERPPDQTGVVIIDNTDTDGCRLVGSWTGSTSDPDYYGSNYAHDQNSDKGNKSAIFTATVAASDESRVELRWPSAANRASNVPVWVEHGGSEDTPAATAANYIRMTQPDATYASDEILVGRVAASDFIRGLIHFDLAASLPADAVVLDARLELTIRERDAGSETYIGTDGIRFYQLDTGFDPATASWNERASGQAWATAGGDFDSEALGIITIPESQATAQPDTVDPGEIFAFPATAAMTAAVDAGLSAGSLDLIVRTPSIESSYPARKLYRFASAAHADPAWRPRLVIRYALLDRPADATIDQRSQGGGWIELTTANYQVGDIVSVILGTAGTDGYVIADAVRILPTTAPSPYADRDGDRLPDWWERWHFLSEIIADPDADPDHDGHDNYTEYRTGTDPWDSTSFFNVRMALDGDSGDYTLRWPSVEGTTYRIEYTHDLAQPFVPLLEGIMADPPTNSHTVTLDAQSCFYRIVPE